MSVCFNTLGTQVLALRRRLPPILYSTFSMDSICQFYHQVTSIVADHIEFTVYLLLLLIFSQDYYNSCTMKSCSFVGTNDEYVISGSDDFNLYMWSINEAKRELKNNINIPN